MPTQRRFEGPTLAAVLEVVQKEAGTDPQIISAQKVRSGGFMGFFQREHYEVVVEISAPGEAATTPAQQRPPVPTSLLDLAEQTNRQEQLHGPAAPPFLVATPKPTTPSTTPLVAAPTAAQASAESPAPTQQPSIEQVFPLPDSDLDTTHNDSADAEPIDESAHAPRSEPEDDGSSAIASAPSFAEVLNRLAFQQEHSLHEIDQEPADVIPRSIDDDQTDAQVDELIKEAPQPKAAQAPQALTQDTAAGEITVDAVETDPAVDTDDDLAVDFEPTIEPSSTNNDIIDVILDETDPGLDEFNTVVKEAFQTGTATPQAVVPNRAQLSTQVAPQLRTRITDTPLARLGLPALYIPELPPSKETKELQRIIADALRDLPQAPDVTPTRGSVIAVVGDLYEALDVAEALLRKWKRPIEEAVIASQETAGLPTQDKSRLIQSVTDSENAKRSWSRRRRPTVVVVDTPLGSPGVSWAEHVLETLEPIATYVVADATRKSEDITAWIEAMGGADAIALNNIDMTVSPASVLSTEIPVDRIDGRTATPELWAMLLAERLVNS